MPASILPLLHSLIRQWEAGPVRPGLFHSRLHSITARLSVLYCVSARTMSVSLVPAMIKLRKAVGIECCGQCWSLHLVFSPDQPPRPSPMWPVSWWRSNTPFLRRPDPRPHLGVSFFSVHDTRRSLWSARPALNIIPAPDHSFSIWSCSISFNERNLHTGVSMCFISKPGFLLSWNLFRYQLSIFIYLLHGNSQDPTLIRFALYPGATAPGL